MDRKEEKDNTYVVVFLDGSKREIKGRNLSEACKNAGISPNPNPYTSFYKGTSGRPTNGIVVQIKQKFVD